MGQVRHGSATTTHAVRAAIQRSQASLAQLSRELCINPVLKPVAKRIKERGKAHKLVIIAIARRLVTIANAIIKTGTPWQILSTEYKQLL